MKSNSLFLKILLIFGFTLGLYANTIHSLIKLDYNGKFQFVSVNATVGDKIKLDVDLSNYKYYGTKRDYIFVVEPDEKYGSFNDIYNYSNSYNGKTVSIEYTYYSPKNFYTISLSDITEDKKNGKPLVDFAISVKESRFSSAKFNISNANGAQNINKLKGKWKVIIYDKNYKLITSKWFDSYSNDIIDSIPIGNNLKYEIYYRDKDGVTEYWGNETFDLLDNNLIIINFRRKNAYVSGAIKPYDKTWGFYEEINKIFPNKHLKVKIPVKSSGNMPRDIKVKFWIGQKNNNYYTTNGIVSWNNNKSHNFFVDNYIAPSKTGVYNYFYELGYLNKNNEWTIVDHGFSSENERWIVKNLSNITFNIKNISAGIDVNKLYGKWRIKLSNNDERKSQKNGETKITFKDIDKNSYTYKVFYNNLDGIGEEYWGQSSVDLSNTNNTSFVRNNPYISEITVQNNIDLSKINSNEQIPFSITIKAQNKSISDAYVKLKIGKDNPYISSQKMYINSDSKINIGIITPKVAKEYKIYYEFHGIIDGKSYLLDHGNFGDSYTVKVVENNIKLTNLKYSVMSNFYQDVKNTWQKSFWDKLKDFSVNEAESQFIKYFGFKATSTLSSWIGYIYDEMVDVGGKTETSVNLLYDGKLLNSKNDTLIVNKAYLPICFVSANSEFTAPMYIYIKNIDTGKEIKKQVLTSKESLLDSWQKVIVLKTPIIFDKAGNYEISYGPKQFLNFSNIKVTKLKVINIPTQYYTYIPNQEYIFDNSTEEICKPYAFTKEYGPVNNDNKIFKIIKNEKKNFDTFSLALKTDNQIINTFGLCNKNYIDISSTIKYKENFTYNNEIYSFIVEFYKNGTYLLFDSDAKAPLNTIDKFKIYKGDKKLSKNDIINIELDKELPQLFSSIRNNLAKGLKIPYEEKFIPPYKQKRHLNGSIYYIPTTDSNGTDIISNSLSVMGNITDLIMQTGKDKYKNAIEYSLMTSNSGDLVEIYNEVTTFIDQLDRVSRGLEATGKAYKIYKLLKTLTKQQQNLLFDDVTYTLNKIISINKKAQPVVRKLLFYLAQSKEVERKLQVFENAYRNSGYDTDIKEAINNIKENTGNTIKTLTTILSDTVKSKLAEGIDIATNKLIDKYTTQGPSSVMAHFAKVFFDKALEQTSDIKDIGTYITLSKMLADYETKASLKEHKNNINKLSEYIITKEFMGDMYTQILGLMIKNTQEDVYNSFVKLTKNIYMQELEHIEDALINGKTIVPDEIKKEALKNIDTFAIDFVTGSVNSLMKTKYNKNWLKFYTYIISEHSAIKSSQITISEILKKYDEKELSKNNEPILVSKNISKNTIWNNDIKLMGKVIVEENSTLTINPGVKIYGDNRASRLIVKGTLKAEGTSESNRIVFTSDSSKPNAEYWAYIEFSKGSKGSLKYVTIEYAGSYNNHEGSISSALYIYSSPRIEHLLLQNISDSGYLHGKAVGIWLRKDASPIIKNSTIKNIESYGIYQESSKKIDLTYKNSIKNSGGGIYAKTKNTGEVDARFVDWGDASGPKHTSNPNGLGSSVTDNVLFKPWGLDSDGDMVPDRLDLYPNNPKEWKDDDKDSIPDNKDLDDDNDGVLDTKDKCQGFNDILDIDGDKIPDGCDSNNTDGPLGDADGDGFSNANELKYGTDPYNAKSKLFNLYLIKGWNLVSLPVDITLNIKDFNITQTDIEIIRSLQDGKWNVWSKTPIQSKESTIQKIEFAKGYWIKVANDYRLTLAGIEKNNTNPLLIDGKWHMSGSMNIDNIDEFFQKHPKITIVWKYRDGKWKSKSSNPRIQDTLNLNSNIEILNTIDTKEAFLYK